MIHDSSAAPPNGPARSTLPIFRASEIVAEENIWLWEGHIPKGALTLLEGHRGRGKTFVAISLAATISRGGVFPDGTTQSTLGDVLILDYENNASTMLARLRAAGADMSRIFMFTPGHKVGDNYPDEASAALSQLNQATNVTRLEHYIDEHCPNVSLLLCDGLIGSLGGIDPNDESKVRAALRHLVALAVKRGIALLGIKHFRKETGGSSRAAGAGSQAWQAVARCVAQVQVVQSQHYLTWEKLNNAALPPSLLFDLAEVEGGMTPMLDWKGPSLLTAEKLARMEAAEGQAPVAAIPPDILERLKGLIIDSGGSITPAALGDRARSGGIPEPHIDQGIKAMRSRAVPGVSYGRVGFGGPWMIGLAASANSACPKSEAISALGFQH